MTGIATITGGAGGIGSACAAALAASGHRVALIDRDHGSVEAAADRLRSAGARVLALTADANEPDQITTAMAAVEQELGPVTVAVSAVAHEEHASALTLTRSQLLAGLHGTVAGALDYLRCAVRQMTDNAGGRIVVIGSLHATLPFAGAAGYNTAQAALRGLTMSLARDLLPHRINVNLVEPGWIDAPGERHWYTEAQLATAGRAHPWGRLGTPEDIAGAVAFLASPAAGYITGSVLRVDGGLSLSMAGLPGEHS